MARPLSSFRSTLKGQIFTSMQKPLIFISHATSDEDIAFALREKLKIGFLGQFDTFLSAVDILAGDEWRHNIHSKLKECSLLIVIATSRSAHGAWVNYEIGAASIQEKKIIALISPGYSHKDLPSTYDTRQGINGSRLKDYDKMVDTLMLFLPNTMKPQLDFSDFIHYFKNFEKKAARCNSLIEVLEKSSMIQDKLPEWLNDTTKSVLMCGIHFQKSLSDHRCNYHDAIRRGVRFTFAVLDPKSRGIQDAALFCGIDPLELKQECVSGLTMLKNLRHESRNLMGDSTDEAIEIILLRQRANARYYIFDREQSDGIVAFTPYTDIRPSHSPTYVYGAMNNAAVQYIQSCKEVLKRYGVKFCPRDA